MLTNNGAELTKKIAFVHLFNDRSGSPKVLSQVISALREKGHGTEVITSESAEGFLNGVADKQRKLFYRRCENKLLTLLFYLISQIHLFYICIRFCRRNEIFYINTLMPFGAAVAAKLLGKKVVFHIHETSIRPRLLKSFLRLIVRLTATRIIFVSEFLCKQESFNNTRQVVIYNAIDNDFLEEGKEPLDKAVMSDFRVLMLSSLKRYKGVFEFLKIAQLCVDNKKLQFMLVLNADEDEIAPYLSDALVPENVIIYPRQTDVRKFYKDSDLLLNLSRPNEWLETFGLTIIEAMAYGLPCIVPPEGGPADIVTDGIDGYLVSSYDVYRVAEKIQSLSIRDGNYHFMSRNARLRATQFNMDKFQSAICGVIEGLN
jgi:glycosyltransferase involved in cell wall biosynthesis